MEQEMKLHGYWNKVGLLLCTGGSAEVSANGRTFRLTRGMLFVISPLVRIRDVVPAFGFETVSFADDLEVFYPIFKLISDAGIPLRVRKCPCWRLSEPEMDYVADRCARIAGKRRAMNDAESPGERTLLDRQLRLIEQEVMLEVMIGNIRRKACVAEGGTGHELTAYRFILEVHENYRLRRSVAWYAARANLSPGYFSAVIKHVTGQSPSGWIAAVTVTYAKFLLEESDRSVKKIAEELNFPEQFTFRKYFKTHARISPSGYRRQCGGRGDGT